MDEGVHTPTDPESAFLTLGVELVRYAGVAAHGVETAATPADD